MIWPTTAPLPEEYQTFEYALEYAGELEGSAIIRTFLRGRPRYWQLQCEVEVDEETALPTPTGRSSLSFLAHRPEDALTACPHPWWELVGRAVAPDLLPAVEARLRAHGRTLDTWWQPSLDEDPEAFTCRFMWPGCDVPRRPVDAFWLTARPQTMRRVFGGLTLPQVQGLMSRPAEPVGVLIDRKGRVLLTEEPDYPVANLWNAYSPFYEIEPLTVYTFMDLWHRAETVRRLRPLGL